MNAKLFLLTCILVMLQSCAAPPSNEITTFILVRHAEKVDDGSEDPALMPEGEQRAVDLLNLLKETSVDAIYSTPYQRTRLTVAPLATEKKIPVSEYSAFEELEINRMIDEHRGGTIVVAGHSDSVPWTANLLTGKETFPAFESEDYNNILIVDVAEPGKAAKVTWLSFGSPAPVPRLMPSM
jgi:phosphohistidine phosphatase SixA